MLISTDASIHVLENIVYYCVQVTTTEQNEQGKRKQFFAIYKGSI